MKIISYWTRSLVFNGNTLISTYFHFGLLPIHLKLWLCGRQMAQYISWSQGCSTSLLISKSIPWTSILVSSSQMVDLVFLYFTFHFYFLFLEHLGLGLIGHAVTSFTTWWHNHKTDHKAWEILVEDLRTDDIIQHRHHIVMIQSSKC